MGKPVPNYMAGNLSRKMMPLDIVMDERICTGYEYAANVRAQHPAVVFRLVQPSAPLQFRRICPYPQ